MRPVPTHDVPPVRLTVATSRRVELVDVSDAVGEVVSASGLSDGTANVWCPHTSCGLTVTEDEEGLHEDLTAVLEEVAPHSRAWAHDDLERRWQNVVPGERPNGDSHVRAVLATSPSLAVPILDGALGLGRWQRLFLVELDGARERTLVVQCRGIPASVQSAP